MATRIKVKTEGGQGGKMGHSQMSHCEHTEVIKARNRKLRRRVGKKVIKEQLDGECYGEGCNEGD